MQMVARCLVVIEDFLHSLKERKGSLPEERDICRLLISAGSISASSVADHLKWCLGFSICCLAYSSLSPCYSLGMFQTSNIFISLELSIEGKQFF